MVLLATKEKGNFYCFFLLYFECLKPLFVLWIPGFAQTLLMSPSIQECLMPFVILGLYQGFVCPRQVVGQSVLSRFSFKQLIFTYGKGMVTPDLSFVFHDLEIFLWGGGWLQFFTNSVDFLSTFCLFPSHVGRGECNQLFSQHITPLLASLQLLSFTRSLITTVDDWLFSLQVNCNCRNDLISFIFCNFTVFHRKLIELPQSILKRNTHLLIGLLQEWRITALVLDSHSQRIWRIEASIQVIQENSNPQ